MPMAAERNYFEGNTVTENGFPIKLAESKIGKQVSLAVDLLRMGFGKINPTWEERSAKNEFCVNRLPRAGSVPRKYTSGGEIQGISYFNQDGGRFNSCQVIYSQFGLAIHQNDHQERRRFVEWAQNKIAVVPDFHKRILFSDEAHFWLNGYVNKQNCRNWSEANPQMYVETPLHPEKLTVWCALWAGGIIGPYFFINDEGHNVTVNGDWYKAMITNFFIPELNNHDVQELWFQEDGETFHTARATIYLLKDTFGDRLISRFGPVNWPSRSYDLSPLDYFLWGYVKRVDRFGGVKSPQEEGTALSEVPIPKEMHPYDIPETYPQLQY
ncbi:putative DD41D transposase [Trichonephila clavipes]|nr:putative DD41D transposase [Trichonephila clavipes]